MKFLICGKGWLSTHFIRELEKSHHHWSYIKSRADDYENLSRELKTERPDRVISVMGRTHGWIGDHHWTTIDYLEQPGKLVENLRDNLYGPLMLSKACTELDIHLLYVGTGCIFEYDASHELGSGRGFTERDFPNFTGSSYSTVKGFTDRLLNNVQGVLNARIRMPISDEDNPRNFITKITTYEKICSIPNSMTVLNELVPIMVRMSEEKLSGTFNMTNPGTISHNRILELYREIVDPEFTWQNFDKCEQDKILASGRSNNLLDTMKLECIFPEVNKIETAVINVLRSMARSKNEKTAQL